MNTLLVKVCSLAMMFLRQEVHHGLYVLALRVPKHIALITQHAIMTFCMVCPYLRLGGTEELIIDEITLNMIPGMTKQERLQDVTATLAWFAARYLELCLFRYLQKV